MYTNHVTRVSWNGICCAEFLVKQDGVISPVLISIYIDKLKLQLSKSGLGCLIGQVSLVLLHTLTI